MKRLATLTGLAFVLAGAFNLALAQPNRVGQDVIWARDIAGATITMDGMLDEAVWDQAETLDIVYGEVIAEPGSGYYVERSVQLADPTDPTNATLRVLRDGNTLWLGIEAADNSIGGGISLFNFDGLIMSIVDRSQRPEDFAAREDANYFSNGTTNAEFFYTWWNPADTTDADDTFDNGVLIGSGRPVPGMEPRFFGDYGVGFNQGNDGENRSEEDRALWDAVTTVEGIANDDTHGEDTGYTMEMRIDLAALGYDMTQPGGDAVPWNIAVQDEDGDWPTNDSESILTRTFWQNRWANNFNEGVAYIYGAPGVTVSSGAAPEVTEPDVLVPNGQPFNAPDLDGDLDDDVWERVEPTISLQYEMSAEDMDALLPGFYPPFGVSWFHPNPGPIILDPSLAEFRFVFRGDILYIGVDVDDQAISGLSGEGGDGFSITLQSPDTIATNQTWSTYRYGFSIDSTGSLDYQFNAIELRNADPSALRAEVSLKGSSTAADPEDVDEGYQMEIAIDLVKALGYPAGRGSGQVYISLHLFDRDDLPSAADSYSTRTWLSGERTDGASVYLYLDPNTLVGTAVEYADGELPKRIDLLGNYPNPFNPSTTLRYGLPVTGEVTIEVFDVLGRQVARLAPGLQSAGLNEVSFDAANLASGLYVYRVQVTQAGGATQSSAEGRMLLLK